MISASESEGEIPNTKAIRNQQRHENLHIDRYNSERRPSFSAHPHSNQSSRRSSLDHHLRKRSRTRSRSRSPYRHDRSPHEEKRPRFSKDDHYDNPNGQESHGKQHQYNNQLPQRGERRSRISYADIDQDPHPLPDASLTAKANRQRDQYRTRSPDRSNRASSRYTTHDKDQRDHRDRRDRRDPYDPRDRTHQRDGRQGGFGSNYDHRGTPTGPRHDRSREKQTDQRQVPPSRSRAHHQAFDPRRDSTPTDQAVPRNSKSAIQSTASGRNRSSRNSVKFEEEIAETRRAEGKYVEDDSLVEDPKPPIDEDALIEERRKRRALIKAKHNAPLRVQVLQSAPNTPKSEQNASADLDSSASTSPHVSPQTPTMDSTPHSPSVFTLEKADDFTGSNLHDINGSTEGQSAADYDPTMDMKEDHLREGHRQGDGGVPASSYDETAPEKRDILLHSSNHIRELHSNQNTDGNVNPVMEEDDDDDMFSDKFGTNAKTQEDSGVTRIPQAKELDVNLLDDWDDHEGYYRIIQGELLDGRYYVKYTLGKGVFASVVAAQNTKTGKMVAIKIVRNKETMKKAGMKEISILKLLNQADEQGKYHMVQLERSFEHKNHLCMVFQFLGENLREVVKKFGRDVGLNITAVRHYAREMFFALHLLKKCQIIHADIKPDNILSYDDHRHLKLCDLGSAAEARDSEITPYLVSRFYRAPEIILGYKYDYAIDMWAVGCTLFELYTGKILFTGNDNNQMLKAIMDCRGRFGLKFLKKCEYAAKYFDDDLSFHSTEWDNVSNRSVVRVVHIREQPLVPLKQRIMPTTKNLTPAEIKYATNFGDLLDKCLALNPEKRITPEQAFNHKFFTETFGAAKTKA